jgi:hypothetical protein
LWRRLLHGNFGFAWAAAANRRGRGLPPVNSVAFGARTAWEAKPFSNARVVPGGLRDKIIFACFAAKAQAQVTVADKAELASAIRTAVFRLGHDFPPSWRLLASFDTAYMPMRIAAGFPRH